ncbi:MAG: pyridoxamine 5'-phosphate oxidase family protein, partial [Planctomycetota bacterium]
MIAEADSLQRPSNPSPGDTPSPFHRGEQAVQERLGVRDSIEPWARRVVRGHLSEEHRSFYASLPYLVVAARDASDRPWVTLLAGEPGFATAPDPATLAIAARPAAGDALAERLVPGADVGILGIELATRRRNRVNGRVADDGESVLTLAVDQAFGNCPQYIRERAWRIDEADTSPVRRAHERFTPEIAERIAHADTFFIGTGHGPTGDEGIHRDGPERDPTLGMDASHRGGEPGFIRVEGDRIPVIPDYAGNNHYNTVGNLVLDPRAGLSFVDFETGGLLQLTGTIEIDWDSPRMADFPGARRLLRFTLDEAIELERALPLRWDAEADSVRTLRLVEKRRESEDVTSFVFHARDGGPLADFSP